MTGIFPKPKMPPQPAPIVTPVVAQTPVVDQVQVERDRSDMLKRRRGRAATVLTNSGGVVPEGSVAAKKLLGQ
jgi:hypothetical protein